MKKKWLYSIAAVVMGAMLLTGCGGADRSARTEDENRIVIADTQGPHKPGSGPELGQLVYLKMGNYRNPV